ncbi:hypothetical protein [Polaribacter sp. R77954]|uniref:hypothetical protein n=1 Tax=Polaribacter sp. R77954 TaxID=3093870 RepID=UPI0037CA619D
MKLSDKIALGIVLYYSVFHVLILVGILPQNIVWGGNIRTQNDSAFRICGTFHNAFSGIFNFD